MLLQKIWGRRHDQAQPYRKQTGLGRGGRRLAGDRHGGQPDGHRIENRGKPASAPPDRSRWPITRSPRISTCARFSLPPATSGWRELAADVEKAVADLQRHKASAAKELEAALATAQRPDSQGTAAEDQGLDGRLYRRRGRSREGADHAAGADRQALGRLGGMDQGRRGPVGFAGHGEAGQSPRDRTFAVSGRCQGERAAGGCLEARRHRRCQFGHRDGQDRGLAEGCLQQAARRSRRPRVAGRGQQPVFDRQALPGRQRGGRKDRAGRRTTSSPTAPSRPPPMSPI